MFQVLASTGRPTIAEGLQYGPCTGPCTRLGLKGDMAYGPNSVADVVMQKSSSLPKLIKHSAKHSACDPCFGSIPFGVIYQQHPFVLAVAVRGTDPTCVPPTASCNRNNQPTGLPIMPGDALPMLVKVASQIFPRFRCEIPHPAWEQVKTHGKYGLGLDVGMALICAWP